MGLYYDFTNCKNSDQLDPTLKEAAMWYTVSLGIGDWSEENIAEVALRMRLFDDGFGNGTIRLKPLGDGGHTNAPFSDDEIRSLIGMHTNVGYETRQDWLMRMTKNRMEVIRRAFPEAPEGDVYDTLEDALRAWCESQYEQREYLTFPEVQSNRWHYAEAKKFREAFGLSEDETRFAKFYHAYYVQEKGERLSPDARRMIVVVTPDRRWRLLNNAEEAAIEAHPEIIPVY